MFKTYKKKSGTYKDAVFPLDLTCKKNKNHQPDLFRRRRFGGWRLPGYLFDSVQLFAACKLSGLQRTCHGAGGAALRRVRREARGHACCHGYCSKWGEVPVRDQFAAPDWHCHQREGKLAHKSQQRLQTERK